MSRPNTEQIQIVKVERIDEEARQLLHEYCEAVQVVKRDGPGELEGLIATHASGLWLAYLEEDLVGCVVLRQMQGHGSASECKRLYVRPLARGYGIAGKLLDALENYAQTSGIRWIYLDSYDDLKAAIQLYVRRGYAYCARYNDNPQATVFMRKEIVGVAGAEH
jgi:GNAT superfamily N-acetyltransferase